MRGAKWAAVVVAAGVLATATTGCGRAPRPSPTDAAPQPTEQVGLTVFAPDAREPAPALAGETLTGTTLDVASMRGDPVIVNAWASWCAPCREEIPLLQELADDQPGIEIVGLDVQDQPDAARAFVADMGISWPSISDPSGELLATVPGVPPKALPSTIVIDRQGDIAARVIGPIKPAMIPELVAAAGEDPGPSRNR